MLFKQIESEGLAHYSYMIGDGAEVAVIDPRRDVQVYLDIANQAGLQITTILETHRNEDYTVGSIELAAKTGARIYISSHEDLGYTYGEPISDGDAIEFDGITIKALHTPGHTLGHMAYVVYENDRDEAYMVFTGDCLFMGDVGRTDFYGPENLEKMSGLLYDSVQKLLALGDQALVLPAHGYGSPCGANMEQRPYSSIGYERRFNPELQVESKAEFIQNLAHMRIKPRYFEVMEVNNTQGAEFVHNPSTLPAVTWDEIQAAKAQLIDVRSKEAFFGGHIPGSLFLSRGNFSAYAGSIVDVRDPIALIASGDDQATLMDVYYFARRIGFDQVIGYLPSALGAWEMQAKPIEKIATISAKDYLAQADPDAVLVDVRRPDNLLDEDPVKNRVNIPLELLYADYTKLPKDKLIYSLCASGDRATSAASFLQLHGYQVVVIEGGINGLYAAAQ